jgi:hypothetical protein
MASKNCYFIAKSDIVFFGRLECSFLSLIITSVIGCTLTLWICFKDSHLHPRLSEDVDGRKYISKHFLSSEIVFLSSGMTVLNILNWSAVLLLQYVPQDWSASGSVSLMS